MKIERKKAEPKFEPITITIESQAELDALWIGMNTSRVTFEKSIPSRGDLDHSSFLRALDAQSDIWQQLNSLR